MKFNSDSAKMVFNYGLDKESVAQGYESVPMTGNLAGKVANQRTGITDPWRPVIEPAEGPDGVEWFD
jgi:hypothetical protein